MRTTMDRMRVRLKACPPEVPLMDAIRVALIDFNEVSPAQIPLHRRRMELILRVPALLAHSTLRFAAWRASPVRSGARGPAVSTR